MPLEERRLVTLGMPVTRLKWTHESRQKILEFKVVSGFERGFTLKVYERGFTLGVRFPSLRMRIVPIWAESGWDR